MNRAANRGFYHRRGRYAWLISRKGGGRVGVVCAASAGHVITGPVKRRRGSRRWRAFSPPARKRARLVTACTRAR